MQSRPFPGRSIITEKTWFIDMELDRLIDCLRCRHLDRVNFDAGLYCDAFPNGIPWKIAAGEVDHRKAFRGDHGIRFEDDGIGNGFRL